MEHTRFFKKTIVFSIFFLLLFSGTFIFSGKKYSRGSKQVKTQEQQLSKKNNINSDSSSLKNLCVDIIRGDGVAQVLQQVLVLQAQFKILIEETLQNQNDETEALESIVDELEQIAIYLGVTC